MGFNVCGLLSRQPFTLIARSIYKRTIDLRKWLIADNSTTIKDWLEIVNPRCNLLTLSDNDTCPISSREVTSLRSATPQVEIIYKDRVVEHFLPCSTTIKPYVPPCPPVPVCDPCPTPVKCDPCPALAPWSTKPVPPVPCQPTPCIPPNESFFKRPACTQIVIEQVLTPPTDDLETIIWFLLAATLWYVIGYRAPILFVRGVHNIFSSSCRCYYTLTTYVAYCIRRRWKKLRYRFRGGTALPELTLAEIRENPALATSPCECCITGRPSCGAILEYQHLSQDHPFVQMNQLLQGLADTLESKNAKDLILLPKLNDLSSKLAGSLHLLETHLMTAKGSSAPNSRSLTRGTHRAAPFSAAQESSLATIQAQSALHSGLIQNLQDQIVEVDTRLKKSVNKSAKKTDQSLIQLQRLKEDCEILRNDLKGVFDSQIQHNTAIENQLQHSRDVLQESIRLTNNRGLGNRNATSLANLDLIERLSHAPSYPTVSSFRGSNERSSSPSQSSSGRGSASSEASRNSSMSTLQNTAFNSSTTLNSGQTMSTGQNQQNEQSSDISYSHTDNGKRRIN